MRVTPFGARPRPRRGHRFTNGAHPRPSPADKGARAPLIVWAPDEIVRAVARRHRRDGWAPSAQVLHLAPDLLLGDLAPAVDVLRVEDQADAPAEHGEDRPEGVGARDGPHDDQRRVDHDVDEQVRPELLLLPQAQDGAPAQVDRDPLVAGLTAGLTAGRTAGLVPRLVPGVVPGLVLDLVLRHRARSSAL